MMRAKNNLPTVLTLEGIVDQGQIKIQGNIKLPDRAKVYVVIPEILIERSVRVPSPRLVNRKQVADFKMEVVEAGPDARV